MSKINFIPDEEIDLNKEDLLETKRYADTLKEIIVSSVPKCTIGLFGKWGTGKSSIIKTVRKELENEEGENIKFIVYDAWKYSGDSFRRTFILRLKNELDPNASHDKDKDNLYDDTIEETIHKNTSIKNFLWSIAIFVLLPIGIIFGILKILPLGLDISLDDVTILTLIPTILFVLYKVIDNSSSNSKYIIQRNKISAPEQFEVLTKKLLEKLLKGQPLYSTKPSWFKKLVVIIKSLYKPSNIFLWKEPSNLPPANKFDKIVIVIDNIDRCDSESSYELLTNIKSFLSNQEGVILLVPVDDEALINHLNIGKRKGKKEAEEFLRKFFNVVFRIKYFNNTDLFQYTDKLNKKNKLGLNEYTVNIIAKEYATNPRRIIQILNNLAVELKFIEGKMDNEFVKDNQSLISILLIIREEWLGLYKRINNQPHKIKEPGSYTEDEEIFFFEQVKNIIKESDILAIDKIVHNFDNDSLIPQELIDLISNSDYSNLENYLINNPEFFDNMIIYLIKEFNNELQRGTFKTSASERFKNILRVHKIKELNKSKLNDIRWNFDSEISKSDILEMINYINVDELDLFFQFVSSNHKFKLNYLLDLSYSKFNKLWSVKYPLPSTDFESLINGYTYIWIYGLELFINNLNDNRFIKDKLATLYTTYYKIHCDNGTLNYLYSKSNGSIERDKLEFLEIKNIVAFIIDKSDKVFILEKDEIHINNYCKELNYLFDTKLVSIEELEPLFDKINLEIPILNNSDNIASLYKAIDELILFVTKLLKKIPTSKTQGTFELIDELVSFLTINHSIYFNKNNARISFLYKDINEAIVDNEDRFKNLLNFFIEACRVTHNDRNISTHIKDLVDKNNDIRDLAAKNRDVDILDNDGVAEDIVDNSIDLADLANINKTMNDSSNLRKAITNLADMNKTMSNSSNLRKAITNLADMNKTMSNSSNLRKAITNLADMNKTMSNSSNLRKAITNLADMNKTMSDSSNLRKAITNLANINRTTSDGSNLQKNLAALANMDKGLATTLNTNKNIGDLVNESNDIKDVYHEKLLKLYEEDGIDFLKMFERDLFAETEYTDNLLKIHEILFEDKDKNMDLVSIKINDILFYILNNDDNKKLMEFMKGTNIEVKEMIKEQIESFIPEEKEKLLKLLK